MSSKLGPVPPPVESSSMKFLESEQEKLHQTDTEMTDVGEEEAARNKFPYPQSCHSVLSSPHIGPILCVRFSSVSGDYLLSGGQDRLICLWNPHKGKLVKAYTKQHGREVNDLCLNHANDKFASVSGDKVLFYWDVLSGEVIRRWRGHEGSINSVHFNEDASVIATGGYDQTVKLWDVRAFAKDPIQTLTGAKDSITCVRIREKSIAATSMDGCVRRWDLRTAQVTTDHLATPCTKVTWSNDGECLLISCLDDTRKLLDKSSGQVLNTYEGAPAREYAMETVFDNTDGYVIGGGEDGIVRVWDLVEAKEVHRYLAHDKPVSSIAWHPKETQFASASVDGTIRYWK